jgi:hypothetical protein
MNDTKQTPPRAPFTFKSKTDRGRRREIISHFHHLQPGAVRRTALARESYSSAAEAALRHLPEAIREEYLDLRFRQVRYQVRMHSTDLASARHELCRCAREMKDVAETVAEPRGNGLTITVHVARMRAAREALSATMEIINLLNELLGPPATTFDLWA